MLNDKRTTNNIIDTQDTKKRKIDFVLTAHQYSTEFDAYFDKIANQNFEQMFTAIKSKLEIQKKISPDEITADTLEKCLNLNKENLDALKKIHIYFDSLLSENIELQRKLSSLPDAYQIIRHEQKIASLQNIDQNLNELIKNVQKEIIRIENLEAKTAGKPNTKKCTKPASNRKLELDFDEKNDALTALHNQLLGKINVCSNNPPFTNEFVCSDSYSFSENDAIAIDINNNTQQFNEKFFGGESPIKFGLGANTCSANQQNQLTFSKGPYTKKVTANSYLSFNSPENEGHFSFFDSPQKNREECHVLNSSYDFDFIDADKCIHNNELIVNKSVNKEDENSDNNSISNYLTSPFK